MTRFYIAGKWEDRYRIRQVMTILEEHGHEITCDWTGHEYEDRGYPVQYSIDDIEGVRDCDTYIGIFQEPFIYRGALVEMGAALALGKEVLIAGNAIDSCMFTHHPLVKKFIGLIDMFRYLDIEVLYE